MNTCNLNYTKTRLYYQIVTQSCVNNKVIAEVGCEIISTRYVTKISTGILNDLGDILFRNLRSTISFQFASLPSTEVAVTRYSYCSYLQLQIWLGSSLNCEQCGWKIDGNNLLPKYSFKEIIPKHIIGYVFND